VRGGALVLTILCQFTHFFANSIPVLCQFAHFCASSVPIYPLLCQFCDNLPSSLPINVCQIYATFYFCATSPKSGCNPFQLLQAYSQGVFTPCVKCYRRVGYLISFSNCDGSSWVRNMIIHLERWTILEAMKSHFPCAHGFMPISGNIQGTFRNLDEYVGKTGTWVCCRCCSPQVTSRDAGV
jgi:hypothetical protein